MTEQLIKRINPLYTAFNNPFSDIIGYVPIETNKYEIWVFPNMTCGNLTIEVRDKELSLIEWDEKKDTHYNLLNKNNQLDRIGIKSAVLFLKSLKVYNNFLYKLDKFIIEEI